MKFGYEDLEVWNRSGDFTVEIIEVVEFLDTPRKHYRLLEQIEAEPLKTNSSALLPSTGSGTTPTWSYWRDRATECPKNSP